MTVIIRSLERGAVELQRHTEERNRNNKEASKRKDVLMQLRRRRSDANKRAETHHHLTYSYNTFTFKQHTHTHSFVLQSGVYRSSIAAKWVRGDDNETTRGNKRDSV